MEFLNVFASVDKDGDLVIVEQDLDNYAKEMNYEKVFTRKWLMLFDNDKDGKITFTEFCETLGLDENIYKEKLLQAREAVKQQKAARPEKSDKTSDSVTEEVVRPQRTRTNRTTPPGSEQKSRLSRPTARASRIPLSEKPVEIKPSEEDVVEDMVKPQKSRKVRTEAAEQEEQNHGQKDRSAGYRTQIIDTPEDESLVEVEFTAMDDTQLEKLINVVKSVEASSQMLTHNERDKRLARELDKQLGKGWQAQTNPGLSHEEVKFADNCMAVLVTRGHRVMTWKAEETGGCCCIC